MTLARRKAAAFPEDSRDPRITKWYTLGRHVLHPAGRSGQEPFANQVFSNELPRLSMLAVVQKKKSFHEIFFDYFKENKTEIAHAIPELFPFLESLKDRSFITDKTYADSYEAYKNSVPAEKVVYKILDNLEKPFGWSFLCTLFNRTNLKAYPGLREIHKNLETELEDKYLSQRSKQDQKLATVHPRCEQGAGDSCSQGSLTWPPSDPASSDGAIRQQSGSGGQSSESTESSWNVKSKHADTVHSILHPHESHRTNYECTQAGTNLRTRENWMQPCFVKQESLQKLGTVQNQENDVIVISSDEEDESELLELFTLTPRRRQQVDEEGEDHVPWAPECRGSLRRSGLLFPDSPFLEDIEEPSRPFSTPCFL